MALCAVILGLAACQKKEIETKPSTASEGSNNNPGDIRGLCPEGWHVPGMGEYTQMLQFLGRGDLQLGGILKETGLTHWLKPNTGATNTSGFTVLGSGRLQLDASTFVYLKSIAQLWTATRNYDPDYPQYQRVWQYGGISYSSLQTNISANRTELTALPVRCVKDVNAAP